MHNYTRYGSFYIHLIYHMEEFHLGLTTLLQNLASLVQALKYQEQ